MSGNWEPSAQRPWYVRWGITFAVGVVIVLVFALGRGIFDVEGAARVWRILCDGCFLAAVLLIGIGLMTMISAEGMFDIVSYGMLCARSAFRKDGKAKADRLPGGEDEESRGRPTFYDYKMAKRGTRKAHWYLVFVGLIFFAGAAFCLLMFESTGGIPMV